MSFFANIRVRLPDYLDKIVRNDATGGVLMLFCTVLALVLQNGSYSTSYRHWLEMQAGVIFGDFQLIKPLLLWINDGLITIFFFSIGLELKIEFIKGHLSELRNVVLPCLGAIAGIIVPSLFFIAFNYDNAYAMRGWAIPTSTDTAFSLAIILLLGSRVPISLRVFLLSMAIFDDIGAILVIALFYTSELSAPALVSASFAIMCLLALNYFGVARKMFYLFFGVILWFSIFKSGMHATLAGIITAFCIPMQSASGEVMVERIYESLKMWVALLVLPVFTIANAGVDLSMIDIEGFLSPVSLGIFTGLFFGKQLGIFATIWLCIKLKLVQAPSDANYRQIYGVCILTGIGFSMSMFIDSLAYQGSSIFEYADSLAILVASLCSGVFGYCFLRFYACRTLEIEYRPWLPAPGGYKGTASTADLYIPTEGASSVAPTAVAVAEANARAAAAAKAAQAAEKAAAAAAAAADAAKKVAEDEDDTQSVAQVQLAAAQAAAAAATAAVSSTKLDTDPDQDTNEVAAAALEAATAAADIAAEAAEAVEAEAAEAEAAEAEAEEAESESEGETAESGAEESAAANEAEPSPDEQSSSEPAESETQASAADTASESQAEVPAGESASAEAKEAAVVSEMAEPAQGVATTEETVGEVTPLSVDSIKPEETADEVVPVESTETAESETKQPEAELDLALHADAVKAALEAEASGENPQQAAAAAVAASKEQETTEAQSEATTSVEAEAVTAAAATTATAATAAESAPVEEAKSDKADKSEKAEKSDKTEKAEAAEKTKEEKKAAKAKKADKAKEKEEKSGNDDDDFAAEYFKNVVKLAQAEVLEPHHHKAETKAQASFSSDPDASLTDAAQTAQDQVVSEETSAVAEAVAHAGNAAGTATDAAVEGAQAEQSPDSAGTANAEATEAQVQPDLDLALNAEAVAAAIAADEAKAQAEAEAVAVQAEAEAEVTTAEQSADMVNFAISQEDAQEISSEVSRQVASVGENMETVDTVPARNKDIADTNFNQDFVQLNTESVTVNYSMEHASDKATEVQPEVSVQQPEPIVPEALAEEPVVVADTSATISAAPAESSAVPAESSAEPVEAVAAEAAEAESVAPAQDQSQAEAQPEGAPQEETQTEPEAKVEAEASEAEAAADANEEAKTESSTWQKLTSVLKKHKD